MNKGFYKDLDTNFQYALELSEQAFTHQEILEMLKNGNIPQKQIAALKLEIINSQEEAKILLSNLTGCDGKIREAVASKINKLLICYPELQTYFLYPEIFANASIDINANICRLVVDSVAILKNDLTFSKIYLRHILTFIEESFIELDNFIFKDKKYVINKQLFKLYWALESLKLFAKDMDTKELIPILEKASQEREYTIREKVAQIVKIINNKSVENIKLRLINDENYYVKTVFSH